MKAFSKTTKLPEPRFDSAVSIETALFKRRSVRRFAKQAVTVAEISQLLWSAQGVTSQKGYRTAPSAGALYPIELYVLAGEVGDLDTGIYKYDPRQHQILNTAKGDKRPELCKAALGQSSVKNAPAVLVFCAVYERVTFRYGDRGIQYVHMEVGHAIQNVCLQAISLGLGSVIIGAFHDVEVRHILNLESTERPLLILPVGRV